MEKRNESVEERDNPEVKERDNPEVESGDTYFAPFVLVCIIAVLLVIMLTYVLSRAPQVDNNSGSKAMIEGCLSLVLQSQPDKNASVDTGHSDAYYADTVAKIVMSCMNQTGYEPYDIVNNQSATEGVAYAVVAGCAGPLVSVVNLGVNTYRYNFGDCVVDSGKIAWRSPLATSITPTSTPTAKG